MSTWSANYGTFVLCISAVLGLVAAYLAYRWDTWHDREWHELRRSKRR